MVGWHVTEVMMPFVFHFDFLVKNFLGTRVQHALSCPPAVQVAPVMMHTTSGMLFGELETSLRVQEPMFTAVLIFRVGDVMFAGTKYLKMSSI